LAGSSSSAWYVDFNDGSSSAYDDVTDAYNVRCVR
jgi:phage baseplate assembly protein gpV